MNVLITGGNGFIGKNLASKLCTNNDEVTLLDIKFDESFYFNTPVNLLEVDLSNLTEITTQLLSQAISKADIIYHCASSVGVKLIDKNPNAAIINNHLINTNLFKIISQYKKRTIYLSSSEVYGETSLASEKDTLKIGSPDVLRWGYACNKLMGEFLLKAYDIPHTIVRPFNVTGVNQKSETGMVMPSFIKRALDNREILIYGDGNQTRCFCDIRDAINMLVLLSKSDEHLGQTYNIGNPQNYISITNLAKRIKEKLNSSSPITYKNFQEQLSNQSSDIHLRNVDTNKISSFYTCQYSIDDIIESFINE